MALRRSIIWVLFAGPHCLPPAPQILTSPLLLLDLFLITGCGFSTRAFMLFSNTMAVLCWMCGAFITKPSRWGFWAFGLLFALGVLIPMIGVLPTAAARCLSHRRVTVQLFSARSAPFACPPPLPCQPRLMGRLSIPCSKDRLIRSHILQKGAGFTAAVRTPHVCHTGGWCALSLGLGTDRRLTR